LQITVKSIIMAINQTMRHPPVVMIIPFCKQRWHFTINEVIIVLYCIVVISHLKLQCCHGNFSDSVKMKCRFENVTDYGHNLSLMILVTNQMVNTWILSKINFPCSGNCLIWDKTHRKLFSNFTCHHLITHANLLSPISWCLDCTTQYPPRKFSAERGSTKPRNGNSLCIRSYETSTSESTVQTTLCRPVICRLDICRTATFRPEIKCFSQTEILSQKWKFLTVTIKSTYFSQRIIFEQKACSNDKKLQFNQEKSEQLKYVRNAYCF